MNMARELIKIHPKTDKAESTNKVIESIKQKRNDFKLKSGSEKVEKEDKKCC